MARENRRRTLEVPGMVAKVRERLACRQVSTTSADAASSAQIDVTAESANPYRRRSWGNGTQELSMSEGRNTKPLNWLKKRLNKKSDAESCFEVGGKFGLIFVNISELDDVDLPTLASDIERDPNSDCVDEMKWLLWDQPEIVQKLLKLVTHRQAFTLGVMHAVAARMGVRLAVDSRLKHTNSEQSG
jgi:hypothetical protein